MQPHNCQFIPLTPLCSDQISVAIKCFTFSPSAYPEYFIQRVFHWINAMRCVPDQTQQQQTNVRSKQKRRKGEITQMGVLVEYEGSFLICPFPYLLIPSSVVHHWYAPLSFILPKSCSQSASPLNLRNRWGWFDIVLTHIHNGRPN